MSVNLLFTNDVRRPGVGSLASLPPSVTFPDRAIDAHRATIKTRRGRCDGALRDLQLSGFSLMVRWARHTHTAVHHTRQGTRARHRRRGSTVREARPSADPMGRESGPYADP